MLNVLFKPTLKSLSVFLVKQRRFDLTKIVTAKYLLTIFLWGVFLLWPISSFAQGVDFGVSYGTGIGLGTQDIRITVAKLIKVSLSVLGIIVTLIIMYSGYMWMTAAGNAQKVDIAKKILLNGVIGLIIIILAYAITSWLFSVFMTASNTGSGGGPCTEGQQQGCNRCIGGQWIFDSSLPSCNLTGADFRVTDTVTSHSGNDPAKEVNRCSRVVSQYSNRVDANSENAAEAVGELSVASHPGEFITSSNSITFKHDDDLFASFTTYQLRLPKQGNSDPLQDKSGLTLTVCDPIVGCGVGPAHFTWNFSTNDEVDEINPYVTKTYPISDTEDPKYPDRNVSRAPIITVDFSENIDPTTVADENGHPLPTNIFIEKLNGEGGQTVELLDSFLWEVNFTGQGFQVYLIAPEILDSFTWYRVTVQNVEDLCGNPMLEPLFWEFETNDNAPGIRSYSPQGNNVCIDTTVLVSFDTSMYKQSVSFIISGSDGSLYNAAINPSSLDPGPYQADGIGGYLRVLDTDDPKSNNFKTFEFVPFDSLNADTTYNVSITTDLVIDNDGNFLNYDWQFGVTDPENCACAPYVTKISPAEGMAGQCITVQGRCFQGTTNNPATPSLDISGINSEIRYVNNDYLTTTVPNSLAEGIIAPVVVTIAYENAALGSIVSNNDKTYYVNQSGIYDGPCLWSMNPSQGCFGQSVNLQGERLGDDPGEGNRDSAENNTTFATSKRAVDGDFTQWNDELIRTKVPSGASDGDVYVTVEGQVSNALPFDISCGAGSPCSGDEMSCSPDSSICQTDLFCNDSCYCQNTGGGDDDGQDGPPRVTKAWPNCNKACPNSEIGAKFSKEIDEATLAGSIYLWQCDAEDCLLGEIVLPVTLEYNTTDFEVYIRQVNDLLVNTKHRVIISNSVTGLTGASLTGLNFDLSGDGNFDSYSWVFTTKDKVCELTKIKISPLGMNFARAGLARDIHGRAISSEQECGNDKYIDATKFDWQWTSDNETVASVSNNDSEDDDDIFIDPDQIVSANAGGDTKVWAKVVDQGNDFTDNSDISVLGGEGQPCDGNAAVPSCQPDNSICASQGLVCEVASCTCQEDSALPEVTAWQPQGTDVCRNALIYVTFNQRMNHSTLTNNTVEIIDWSDQNRPMVEGSVSSIMVLENEYYCTNKNGCTVAKIYPNELLKANNQYVFNVGDSGEETPISYWGKEMVVDFNTMDDPFETGDVICRLDKLDVDPSYYLFTLAGEQKNYIARSFDSHGQELAPIPDFYDWQITWREKDDNKIIELDPGILDGSSKYIVTDAQTATANNQNGRTDLTAIAEITTAVTSTKDVVGRRLRDSAEAESFICTYPWPIPADVNSYQPFFDSGYGFQTRYCRSLDGENKKAGLSDCDNSEDPADCESQLDPPTSVDVGREYLFYYTVDVDDGDVEFQP